MILSACWVLAATVARFEMPRVSAAHVAVVYNSLNPASKQIAQYYIGKRHIPAANVLAIRVNPIEQVKEAVYQKDILEPVKKFLSLRKGKIDYIVLTKYVPIRVQENGFSVDSLLASMDKNFQPMPGRPAKEDIIRSLNPYFEKKERFSHSKFGLYLVTRLDGYSVSDALQLVDHSIEARAEIGPFFFDEADNRKTDSYGRLQATMEIAQQLLKLKNFDVSVDTSSTFVAPSRRLMGYTSWGSNDGKFNLDTYHQLKFKSGAIAETFVSTSGRTFNKTKGGQSLIADLISQGVTGVKGYVSEPFTIALARPHILFERYVSGFNLAESFYMASPLIKWKDVVIGDPLCAPYAKNGR